jgi:GntR family transcriptional regulator
VAVPPHTGRVTLDRNSPLPLWAQVLGDLRTRLARGEFTGRFPGDEELRAQYGVSRHTVREAVRRLQSEGVIERGRGRGTFVTGTLIEQPLGALYSLFRSVEAQGFVQRSVVRYLEERRNEEAAKVLGRPPDEPLVYLERLRPVLPSREQRDLLGLGAHTPALALERLASASATPVEWRHGLVRADRFSYVARWSAAQDTGARFEPAAALDSAEGLGGR